jgi:transposase
MPTTLSVDLRQRVASAVAAGATCREAAERFGVSRAKQQFDGWPTDGGFVRHQA